MDKGLLLGMGLIGLALLFIGGMAYVYFFMNSPASFRTMMSSSVPTERESSSPKAGREAIDIDRMRREKRRRSKRIVFTLDQKFFMAGMYTDREKLDFKRMRIVIPLVVAPVITYGMYSVLGAEWAILGAIMGALLGMQVPFSILDRRIADRSEDIMYYLPLVIEQIAIGVSSSLDIGPCIQRVVSMADERDTHNVVTELVKISQNYVRSGASLNDALTEVGILSGHTELKHTFMSLAQVARHGGEITRQLQELADAVASQRETKIEAKIKKLELVATGPVALVFAGFLIILLIGFGLQISTALG